MTSAVALVCDFLLDFLHFVMFVVFDVPSDNADISGIIEPVSCGLLNITWTLVFCLFSPSSAAAPR